MGEKRFKDLIIAEILATCEGEGANKTKVVYDSGLNFHTIKPCLATLDRERFDRDYPRFTSFVQDDSKG